MSTLLKKPKVEDEEENGEEEETTKEEQEEAFIALIEHHEKEVEHLRKCVSYYTSELAQEEKRLEDSHSKLARLRGQGNTATMRGSVATNGNLKVDSRSDMLEDINDGSRSQAGSRTELVIPSVTPKTSQSQKSVGSTQKTTNVEANHSTPSNTVKK